MSPWKILKWMMEIFLGGSFVIQRGWGCKGCVIGLLWFLGLGYLFIYMVSPIPDFDRIMPRQYILIAAIFFIVLALIARLVFSEKKDTFHGRNRPPD